MTTYLVATDLSSRAEQALRMAVLLARRSDAALKLVYAIDADQPAALLAAQRESADSMVQRLARTIEQSDGIPCQAEIAIAAGIDDAVLTAAERDTALIILGRHRTRPLRDLFLSSTSERIIAHARCPVLVTQTPPLEPHRKLLIATDLSDEALAAAATLTRHPVTAGLPTTLLHVVGALEDQSAAANRTSTDARDLLVAQAQATAQQRLDRFVDRVGLEPVKTRVECDGRPTATTILDIAGREGVDLIAVHRRPASTVERAFGPSTITRLLNSAPVDLLIV